MSTWLATSVAAWVAACGAGPRVEVQPVSGAAVRGALVAWSDAEALRVEPESGAASQPAEWSAGAVSQVRFLAATTQPQAGPWRVVTAGGEVFAGNVSGGDDEAVTLDLLAGGRARIGLDGVRRIERNRGWPAIPTSGPAADRVRLANGDVVEGIVSGAKAESLRLSAVEGGDARDVAWAVIEAVDLSAGDAAERESGAERGGAWVFLTDGQRWRVSHWRWTGEGLEVESGAVSRGRLPAGVVAAVEVETARRRWLSVLEPAAYESRPVLGPAWALGRDCACTGGALRVGGMGYSRGLGLHAACRVTWNLEERYARFAALAALDDTAESPANARVRVLIDGREAARTRPLTRSRPSEPMDVDISGARTLTIEVQSGLYADVQDRVDLIGARLIRAE